jgi:SAM-dependent methyltransferase
MLNRALRRLRNPCGRSLLDIGAGNGLLVRLARDSGWDAEGTELSHQLRALAKTRYGVELHDPSDQEIPSNAFDVVTLINVLDQSPDPIKLLQDARRALRRKGRLFVRVPNASFHFQWVRLTSFIKRGHLESLAVLHDYGFSRKSLSASLLKNSFKPTAIRNASLTGSLVLGDRQGVKLMMMVMRGVVATAEMISRGRILWAPSIEVEAERLDDEAATERATIGRRSPS